MRGPRETTHIGAESDLDTGSQGLLERYAVDRSPLAVAFASQRVRRIPIIVVDRQRRNQPGTLLHHLCNLSLGELEAVLDGIATAIQRPLEPDTVVGVTGDLFAPAMRLIDDRFELLDRQGGLRNEGALFIHP
jgi:hypothetical protein